MDEQTTHSQLQIGMPAPDFTLTIVQAESVHFADLWPSGPMLLIIHESTLGGVSSFLPDLQGKSYIGFILPLSIVSRMALLLGPILAGAVILLIHASTVMIVAILLGLNPATGPGGVLLVLIMSMLVGISIAGFTVAAALASGNAAATQGASFIFFPLTFVTASFVPLDLLDGWLQTAARLNPITYVPKPCGP